ncbi:hypothetical protein ZEAMMB73_Zm00001d042254 [Zea mays]|uniref:Uncharacterized protein n=1 Tax=Zea mays TaxID=4577 RepID=A0A1D6N2B7_MAIZE|nr:hypothetical protein ZEAMMB73_Zm00001d042254 [Zea mays]
MNSSMHHLASIEKYVVCLEYASFVGEVCHICSSPLFNLDLDTLRYVSYIPNHCLLLYEAVTYAIHNAVLAGGLWGSPQKVCTTGFFLSSSQYFVSDDVTTSRYSFVLFLSI